MLLCIYICSRLYCTSLHLCCSSWQEIHWLPNMTFLQCNKSLLVEHQSQSALSTN